MTENTPLNKGIISFFFPKYTQKKVSAEKFSTKSAENFVYAKQRSNIQL